MRNFIRVCLIVRKWLCISSFVFAVLIRVNDARAQTSVRRIVCSPGVSYQEHFFGEINLMYADVETGHIAGVIGPRVGMEVSWQDRLIYAPKIGYEIAAAVITFRGNIIGYVDRGRLDMRVLPEVGGSLLGSANLTYGYNAPLLTYRSEATSRHRITLTVNIISDIWDELRK
ncbi:hypothetical protein [Hymenobacter pini]|uniref:hypothetical protein n=1 Tax=Hymenobacter pini TaxID=2880879 RepID=UPI001CF2979B|nr:hypothetical protein [Hymenobacter pini]MCA8833176.1 hypothetical protein [Hymenobacter pini]